VALEEAFATELGFILEEYLSRLGKTAASETEQSIHHALEHALLRAPHNPFRKMVHLISSLPEQLSTQILKGHSVMKDLIGVVDEMSDGDVNARQLDKAWLKCFESEQAVSYLFLGGPGKRLELDLQDLTMPKTLDSTSLVAISRNFSEGCANTDLPHIAEDLAHAVPESVKIHFGSNPNTGDLRWITKLQVAVENLTDAQWDWWPLIPPQQAYEGNYERVTWSCVCSHLIHKP
jgi:hypothetical protein